VKYENLERLMRALIAGSVILGGASLMSACDEGPFEEAGEEIGDAADEIEDEL
jgi:hypothetical protein